MEEQSSSKDDYSLKNEKTPGKIFRKITEDYSQFGSSIEKKTIKDDVPQKPIFSAEEFDSNLSKS